MHVMEKAVAPHSSTLAWKTHGWRSLVGYSPWGRNEQYSVDKINPIVYSLGKG